MGCVGKAEDSKEDFITSAEETSNDVEDTSSEELSEIEDVTENLEKVSGTEFETPDEYELYFEGDILADLEELPDEVQEYIRNEASVHVIDPFVHDEEARRILIEAYKQVLELNANDVDALISNTVDENLSYEERLKKYIESKNK